MNTKKIINKLAELNEIQQDRSILLTELRRSKVEAWEFRNHILEQVKSMTQDIKKISQELLSDSVLA